MLLSKWNRRIQDNLNKSSDFVKCNVGMTHLTRPAYKATNYILQQMHDSNKRRLFESIPKVEGIGHHDSASVVDAAESGSRPGTRDGHARPSTRGTSATGQTVPLEEGGPVKRRLTPLEKQAINLRKYFVC